MTADEAATYFAQLNPKRGELDDDDLDAVAGGACADSNDNDNPAVGVGDTVQITSEAACPACGGKIGTVSKKHSRGYVCVDEMGNIIIPNYLTTSFQVLLEKNGMRKIRFHDLRHTCASLLLKNGVPMKQIQEWLGHSDFSTTANIYAHLDYNSKLNSADAMISGMSGALNFVS